MRTLATTLSAALMLGTFALAHTNIDNPVVAARMQAMMDIAAESKTLSNMARGRAEFDADTAAASKANLAAIAADIPNLFAENVSHPESEASPKIWENFAGFTAQAEAFAAGVAALDVSSAESIGATMGAFGSSCRSCHGPYRD